MKKLHLDSGWCGWFSILLAAAFIALWSVPAFSAEQAIARLTKFSGRVLIKSQGSWAVKPKEDLPLYSGDKLVTKIGSATITFDDGAVMEIKPNSNLTVQESEEEETSLGKKVRTVKRRLRLLLGKMLFKTGRGSAADTTLETGTMVCGLRGTAGTLSIGANGQTYLQFTEGSGSTVGDFISGVAEDVPPELASLNPAQRAAFIAAAAAEQAAQAAERAASGDISEADAALAGAQAAEAAAQEARAAAEAMLNNPDPDIQAQAAQAVIAADEAIAAAQAAKQAAIDAGATPGEGPEPYEPPEGEEGFDVIYFEAPQGVEEDILPEPGEGDTTAPVIEIISGPGALTNLASALFELEASESATFFYSTDGGETWKEFDIGTEGVLDLRGIPEGESDIRFRATDGAGNVSDITAFNWTADYTAPVSSIPTKPGAIANTSSFGFDATDANKAAGIIYEYRLDGGTWVTLTGTTVNLGLATGGSKDGSHTLEVRATDAANNTGTAVSYTWTYDTIAPVSSIPTKPGPIANASSFGFDATDANKASGITYEYRLDGGTWITLSGKTVNLGLATGGSKDGSHILEVRAKDIAGNTGTATSYTWTYDTIAPTITFSASPEGDDDATVTASYSNDEPGTVSYIIDGVSATSVSGLEDGAHTLTVTATDEAGNSTGEQEFTFTLNLSSLAGDVVGTGSDITGSVDEGASAAVQDANWGGWETGMSGTYTGEHEDSFSIFAGGDTSGADESNDGYWLSKMTGTGGEGISNFTSLNHTSRTEGTGTVAIEFDVDGVPNTWEATETGSGLVEESLAFSGQIYYAGIDLTNELDWLYGPHWGVYANVDDYLGPWGDFEGLAGSSMSPWVSNGSGWQPRDVDKVTYMGEYYWSEEIANGPYIWNNDLYSYNIHEGSENTFDNGAFYGFIGGVWNEDPDNIGLFDVDARAVSLYIDPDGNIGHIKGTLAGSLYRDLDILLAEGSWSTTQMALAADVNILPGDFYNEVKTDAYMQASLFGQFDNETGTISGEIPAAANFYGYEESQGYTGWTRYIDGQNWGIYDFILDGYGSSYDNPSEEWSAKIGGTANFGTYYADPSYVSDSGYWLADITSGTWEGGKLTGSLGGKFLTHTKKGDITGDLIGYYDDSGNWAATSLGTYEGELLDFSGDWGPLATLYYNDNGQMSWTGHEQGNIGLISLGEGDYSLLAIGDYYDYGYGGYGGPYLWNTEINGNEVVGGESGEYGGLHGYTGGIWDSESELSMNGYVAAVSWTKIGKAMLFAGDVSGDFYEMSADGSNGMWMVDGTLSSQPIPELPDDFSNDGISTFSDSFGALVGGYFGEGSLNTIYGEGDNYSEHTFITYNYGTESLPWGIYNLRLGSWSSPNKYSGKNGDNLTFSGKIGGVNDEFGVDENSFWIADIGGTWYADGTIGNGAIENGIYLTQTHKGTIGGPFYGLYTGDGSGTWVGESVGTYAGNETLDFGGDRHSGSGGLLYNNNGYISGTGLLQYGQIGLTSAIDDGYDFLAIGDYVLAPGSSMGSFIWRTKLNGNEVIGGETGEYGSLRGYSGGLWDSESALSMNGYVAAVSWTESGNAMLLAGDVSGDFYEMSEDGSSGMWMVDGTLSSQPIPELPDDFSYGGDPLIDYNLSFTGRVAGYFGEGPSDTIYGQSTNSSETIFITYLDENLNTSSPPWGVYRLLLGNGGSYNYFSDRPLEDDQPSDTVWSGMAGGWGGFGYDGFGYGGPGNGYWLAAVGGDWSADGEIKGLLGENPEDVENTFGVYLTKSHMGSIGGQVFGRNFGDDPDPGSGYWIGESVGTYVGEPLIFTGETDGSLMYYNGSILTEGSHGYGLLGATELTYPEITLLGRYDEPTATGPFLMYGSGFDLFGAGTTSGSSAGDAFNGYMVGIWRDEDIDAMAIALYIDSEQNAGYRYIGKGEEGEAWLIDGAYYPGIYMWEATGALIEDFIETTAVLPSNLSDSLLTDHFEGSTGFGDLNATFAEGDPKRIDGHNWGIWNAGFGGTYDGVISDTWELYIGGDYYQENLAEFPSYPGGNWMGRITGTSWGVQDISGIYSASALTYDALYEFEGDILGTRKETGGSGDWQAAGIGTYTMESLAFVSDFYAYIDSFSYDEGEMNGLMGGADSLWTGTNISVTLIGDYIHYEDSIWYTGDYEGDNNYISSYNYRDDTHTTYDGGAYVGYMGGFVGFEDVTPFDDLEGKFVGLYIDPYGNAGYLISDNLEGNGYSDIGMFEMNGTMNRTLMATLDTSPEGLYDNTVWAIEGSEIEADVGDSGFLDIDTIFEYRAIYIDGDEGPASPEPWGIWNSLTYGVYNKQDGLDIWTDSYGSLASDGGFIERIEGEDNLNGSLRLDYDYAELDLDMDYLYRESGTIFNDYEDYTGPENLSGIGLGTFVAGEIVIGGTWGDYGYEYNLYNYESLIDDWETAGEEWGYMGGVTFPWEGPSYFLALGEYEYTGESDPTLWNTPIYSEGVDVNGGFYGYTGGIWQENTMEGMAVGLYGYNYGNGLAGIGLINGDVSGNYYEELGGYDGMWMAEGLWKPYFTITGLDLYSDNVLLLEEDDESEASTLGDYIADLNIRFSAQGALVDNGYNWYKLGVFSALGYGTYTAPETGAWISYEGDLHENERVAYLEIIDGTDNEDGTLRADYECGELNGYYGYLYREAETYFGTYDGSEDLALSGVGTYIDGALAFFGDWYGEGESLYYNEGNNLVLAGDDRGFIGGITLPWEESSYFLAIGEHEYEPSAPGGPYVWKSPIYAEGYNGELEGFTAGIWKDGTLHGAAVALYGSGLGYGFLAGDVSGSYYDESGMWMAEGTLSPRWMTNNVYDGYYWGPEEPDEEDYSTDNVFISLNVIDTGIDYTLGTGIFGVWASLGYGEYDNPDSLRVWGGYGGVFNEDYAYLEIMEGIDNADGTLRLDGELAELDLNDEDGYLYRDSGTYFGTYDADGVLVVSGVGTNIEGEGDLAFGGDWGFDDGSLYDYNSIFEYIEEEGGPVGSDYGILGGITSPWEEPSYFLAIGEYDSPESGDPYVWNTPIYAEGFDGDGEFEGYTAGIWKDGTLHGTAVALYGSEGGYGFIRGDVTGSYYEEPGMWMAEGILSPHLITDDINDGYYWGSDESYTENYSIGDISLVVDVIDEGIQFDLNMCVFGVRASLGYGSYNNPDGSRAWNSYDGVLVGDYADLGVMEGIDNADGTLRVDIELAELEFGYGGYYLSRVSRTSFGTYDAEGNLAISEAGTYIDADLAFEGEWGEGYECLYYYDQFDEEILWAGDDYGILGGIALPWEESSYFLAIGEYDDNMDTSIIYLLNSSIEGYEIDGYGGYFNGFVGGIWKDGTMNGMVAAFYNDGQEDIGILTGDITGHYRDVFGGYGGMWMAEGILSAGDFGSYPDIVSQDGQFISEGYEIGTIDINTISSRNMKMTGNRWGLSFNTYEGEYGGSTSNDWILSVDFKDGNMDKYSIIIGSQWECCEKQISAQVAGAWVDLEDATTGVMGGDLVGTFDPSNWVAVSSATMIDTETFLSMASMYEDGHPTLNDLNIPAIQVGETTLTGSGGNLTQVNMNAVKFFAYSTGAMPRIWATGDVSGITKGTSPAGSTASLTGDNMNATFHMNGYNDTVGGKWDASVTGSGNINGSIQIKGGAAGFVEIAGAAGDSENPNFTGTGAGVARPQSGD